MTDIGSSMLDVERQGLEQGLRVENAQPVRADMPRANQATERKTASSLNARGSLGHRFWDSVTESLNLACRGYLGLQLVDCDPVTDPECSASGKKVVLVKGSGVVADSSPAGETVTAPMVFKERKDAHLSGQ